MKNKTNMLYISVDACRYDYILHPERYGLKLPNIRNYFVDKGGYASKGVQGVFPTFTYPSHASMITGATPLKHKIYNNNYFDATNQLNGAWYWYAGEGEVKTLWDEASDNGYLTANVGWSTSLGAKLDYDIPQVWLTSTELDVKFIDNFGSPKGLLKEFVRDVGSFTGYNWDGQGDRDRTEAAIWLLRHKLDPRRTGRPFFMTMYFASYDDTAHNTGTMSEQSQEILEWIDRCIGQLVREANAVTDGNLNICLVSDHGMIDNKANVYPNSALWKAGLIEVDGHGKVVDWKAYSQRAGGVGAVYLKDPRDASTRQLVERCLLQLQEQHPDAILEVLDRQTLREVRRGFGDADFAVVSGPGYEIREDIKEMVLDHQLANRAQHGYSEFFEEMRSMYFLVGKDIPQPRDVGAIQLIDIAPTLAQLMGFEMQGAEGEVRL